MLLLHCEQDLEDCFDETGLDDVFFTIHEEVTHYYWPSNLTIAAICMIDEATQSAAPAAKERSANGFVSALVGGQYDKHQGVA